jgi:hypothetical protein
MCVAEGTYGYKYQAFLTLNNLDLEYNICYQDVRNQEHQITIQLVRMISILKIH